MFLLCFVRIESVASVWDESASYEVRKWNLGVSSIFDYGGGGGGCGEWIKIEIGCLLKTKIEFVRVSFGLLYGERKKANVREDKINESNGERGRGKSSGCSFFYRDSVFDSSLWICEWVLEFTHTFRLLNLFRVFFSHFILMLRTKSNFIFLLSIVTSLFRFRIKRQIVIS